MEYKYDKGGRNGSVSVGDCVPRAIAIISNSDYYTVLKILQNEQKKFIAKYNQRKRKHKFSLKKRSPQRGTFPKAYEKVLKELGGEKISYAEWTSFDSVPKNGRLLVKGHKHLTAVIDGEVRDTWESHLTREYTDEDGVFHPKRMRMIKSYWVFPENIKKLSYAVEKE